MFPPSLTALLLSIINGKYVSAGTTNIITGATNGTLSLTNIQAAQSSYNYFVVVTNAYGAATSSFVTLNILSGPPLLTADISPLLTEVPAGLPVNFSVSSTGTEPFFYQWSADGAPITGATKSSYSLTALAGSNTYSVVISNSVGSTPSSTAVVIGVTTPPTVIGFNGTGSNWILNQFTGVTFLPFITNNILELTDGNLGEASSAFYDTPQFIGGFTASTLTKWRRQLRGGRCYLLHTGQHQYHLRRRHPTPAFTAWPQARSATEVEIWVTMPSPPASPSK